MAEANPPKVLLVDDELSIHLVFEDILGDLGFDLDCAASAEEALENLKGKTYDLAILDKNLPGMSGLDLMRIMRGVHMNMKVIMITGFGSYDAAVEALRLGAADFIEKPFRDLDLVVDKIQKTLQGTGAEACEAKMVRFKNTIEAAFVPLGEADAELERLQSAGGDRDGLLRVRQTLAQLRDLLVIGLGEAEGK